MLGSRVRAPEGVQKGKDESLSLFFVLGQLHAVRVMNRVMIGQRTSSLLSSLYSYSADAEQHLPQKIYPVSGLEFREGYLGRTPAPPQVATATLPR